MTEAIGPPSEDQIPGVIRDILAGEFATARSRFRDQISQTVADFGATGNRFGTSLVNALEKSGRLELQERAAKALAVWTTHIAALPPQPLTQVLASMNARLALEVADIESAVLGVQMGNTPTHPEFLDEQARLASRRLAAELSALLTAHDQGTTRGEIVQLKPEVWGLSLDLKELWRRFRRWASKSKADRN